MLFNGKRCLKITEVGGCNLMVKCLLCKQAIAVRFCSTPKYWFSLGLLPAPPRLSSLCLNAVALKRLLGNKYGFLVKMKGLIYGLILPASFFSYILFFISNFNFCSAKAKAALILLSLLMPRPTGVFCDLCLLFLGPRIFGRTFLRSLAFVGPF